MIVRLDPPEPELRIKLVRTLAQRRCLLLDEASVSAIAHHSSFEDSSGSVREIEGLLTRVDACHRMLSNGNGPVGASAVRLALGSGKSLKLAKPIRPVRIADIVAEVCRTLSVERDDVFGKGRHRRVVLARALCAHIARELTTLSYPEIARGIGPPQPFVRDHRAQPTRPPNDRQRANRSRPRRGRTLRPRRPDRTPRGSQV